MCKYDVDKLYDLLVDEDYFTDEELNLVTNINGYSLETLYDCLYCRYGIRNEEQLEEDRKGFDE